MNGRPTVSNFLTVLILLVLAPLLIPLGFLIGAAYGPEDTVPEKENNE